MGGTLEAARIGRSFTACSSLAHFRPRRASSFVERCLLMRELMAPRFLRTVVLVVGAFACFACESAACHGVCESQYDRCEANRDPGVPGDPCGDQRASCESQCDSTSEDDVTIDGDLTYAKGGE